MFLYDYGFALSCNSSLGPASIGNEVVFNALG